MKVKTKYDIDDVVWYISNNSVMKEKITGVYVNVLNNGEYGVAYDLGQSSSKYMESSLYPSKKELLKTL